MFEAIFPYPSIPARAVARIGFEVLSEAGWSINASDIERLLEEAGSRGHFDHESEGRRLAWTGIANHELAQLVAAVETVERSRGLLKALGSLASPVMARLYDRDYDHWQNATDPLEFEARGRPLDGLVLTTNGLPQPLEKQVVDTSRNPGRRVLRNGYVEAIGHRIWLGAEFFRRVPGASRAMILSAPWLESQERPGEWIEIAVPEGPFTDSGSSSCQRRLRALLFPGTGLVQ